VLGDDGIEECSGEPVPCQRVGIEADLSRTEGRQTLPHCRRSPTRRYGLSRTLLDSVGRDSEAAAEWRTALDLFEQKGNTVRAAQIRAQL
jgi:hypothetical protein